MYDDMEIGTKKVVVMNTKATYYRLSTEPQPTEANDGDELIIVDTGAVFIYYAGEWRPF